DRERIVKKRARETKTPICYLNLVGGQDELVFDGSSFVVDEKGKITARAKEFEEDLLIVEFPLRKKKSAFVSLSPLARVYQALVLGARDYVRKNGFKKVVIGLSGGIDSALVAAIAVDAIGKENVVGVSMPSRFSSSETQTDAKQLAQNLGISFKEISIETIFKAYLETFSKEFKDCPLDITEENIQARIRGNILMALSNKFGWLVLTTGNKSEVAVGYCTLYGDMSGGFAVIKDVPKTKVYELAKYYNNKESRAIIPSDIFKRAPSAELRMNQKDQDSLPCYDVLDGLLADYVEKHASYATMSRSQNKDVVKKVIKLVDKSEYKRRQSPPGIKISSLAFGKDWRLPITNQYKEF
ncbi:MAG TPA: NAD+ synthase, partial [Candidatus Omnitrophota bacterium]|nr:NAD+ synthase [Candidatus Omnitrophota bacterium]